MTNYHPYRTKFGMLTLVKDLRASFNPLDCIISRSVRHRKTNLMMNRFWAGPYVRKVQVRKRHE